MTIDGHATIGRRGCFLHPRRKNNTTAIRLPHSCTHTGSTYFIDAGATTFAATFKARNGYRTFLRVQGN